MSQLGWLSEVYSNILCQGDHLLRKKTVHRRIKVPAVTAVTSAADR
jgi:hypothetical protein